MGVPRKIERAAQIVEMPALVLRPKIDLAQFLEPSDQSLGDGRRLLDLGDHGADRFLQFLIKRYSPPPVGRAKAREASRGAPGPR